jgi:hypothetical protein
MNTAPTVKRRLVTSVFGAAVTGAAAPALLMLGTGTAHADDVTYDPFTGSGLVAHVQDTTGRDSLCTYTASPSGPSLVPLPPFYSPPFWLPANGSVPVYMPAPIAPGLTWSVNVVCIGNQSPTTVSGGPGNTYTF